MFNEKHMRNVAKELREAFDFFLTDRIRPHSISVGDTYVGNLWCILIDNWLTIVPQSVSETFIDAEDRIRFKYVDSYELREVVVESNYPHEPDYIEYSIIGVYQSEDKIIDNTLKYILNKAMEAYGEMKCYEKLARECPSQGVW